MWQGTAEEGKTQGLVREGCTAERDRRAHGPRARQGRPGPTGVTSSGWPSGTPTGAGAGRLEHVQMGARTKPRARRPGSSARQAARSVSPGGSYNVLSKRAGGRRHSGRGRAHLLHRTGGTRKGGRPGTGENGESGSAHYSRKSKITADGRAEGNRGDRARGLFRRSASFPSVLRTRTRRATGGNPRVGSSTIFIFFLNSSLLLKEFDWALLRLMSPPVALGRTSCGRVDGGGKRAMIWTADPRPEEWRSLCLKTAGAGSFGRPGRCRASAPGRRRTPGGRSCDPTASTFSRWTGSSTFTMSEGGSPAYRSSNEP